jgi:hypothetical protein
MTLEEAEVKYPILKYFEYRHLPQHLQLVSAQVCNIAETLAQELPYDPETSAGLRKLLEAKDCFVRAELSRKKK